MYRHLVGAVGASLKRLLLLVILLVVLGSTGTVTNVDMPVEEVNTLSPSKVVFLEHSLLANGTVVKGEVPFRAVNFPNYWFNQNTRQLNGNIDFALNDSLIAIYGDILTLKGDFGAGTGNKLFGIYNLPVKADQATIVSIDRSGTIGLYVNNEYVYLRPGEEYRFNQTEALREAKGLVNVEYQHLYTNHGIINKNSISTRMIP